MISIYTWKKELGFIRHSNTAAKSDGERSIGLAVIAGKFRAFPEPAFWNEFFGVTPILGGTAGGQVGYRYPSL